MMAGFAQFERDIILERTAQGLARARERGKIGGAVKKIHRRSYWGRLQAGWDHPQSGQTVEVQWAWTIQI